MKTSTLYDALPIVATAYGDKFGVKIKVGGMVAYTNGKEINIPNIPDSFGNKDVIWGYLAHEAAHVRYTDFQVARHTPLHAELVNIIEDCRIEQLMIKRYPGTDQTLNAVATYMANAGHYSMVSDDTHSASVITAYSLYYLQGLIVGQSAVIPFFQSAKKVFEERFPLGVQQQLTQLLNEAAFCNSTQEASVLASKIIEMLDEEAQEPDADPSGDDSDDSQASSDVGDDSDDSQASSGAGDDSDDSQASSGAGDDSDDSQASSDADDDSDDSQASSGAGDSADDSDTQDTSTADSDDDANDASHSGQSTNQQGKSNSGADADADAKKRAAIKDAIQACDVDLLGDATEKLRRDMQDNANPDDRYIEYITSADNNVGSLTAGTAILTGARAKSSGISQRLQGLVQAKQRTGYRSTRHGTLDTKRIAQVVTGNTKVFKKRDDKVGPNTAIHILVDMSGSMGQILASGQSCYEVAQESAAALALALEPINGVSSAVTYFESQVKAVKRRNETVASKTAAFGSFSRGGTALAEAMWYAGYELSRCKEDRKVIIIITDGEPDCEMSVREITNLCVKSGFDVLAIGINTKSVLSLFKSSVVINSALDLKTVLFKLIEKTLI